MTTTTAPDEITITLMNAACGSTESLCVSASNTTVSEIVSLARALFGHSSDVELTLFRDGKKISHSQALSIGATGVKHGDILAVVSATKTAPSRAQLDFSSLLAQHPVPSTATTSSTAVSSLSQRQQQLNLMNSKSIQVQTQPVEWYKMNLEDAIEQNPNPDCFVSLLFSYEKHPNLFKELNHRSPALAKKMQDAFNTSVSSAANVWREELVKGSIQRAFHQVQVQSKEREMQFQLSKNPSDPEALLYFEKQQQQQQIDTQYQMVMDQYPESMGRVLMLYVDVSINNVPIKAFVDSGAQMTIISEKSLAKIGLSHLIDTRFAGVAVGVGTGKILGRVHVAPLLMQNRYFPVTLTVLESNTSQALQQDANNKDVDFIFGLDMLKRHRCKIDLERNMLVIPLDQQQLEVPFLHEKDLDVDKGGTKGFDAEASNDELMQRMLMEVDEKDSKNKQGSDGFS